MSRQKTDNSPAWTESVPWKHIHFIGIAGAGMSALASIALERGVTVSGSDLVSSATVSTLCEAGAEVTVGHQEGSPQVEAADCVVFSSAVPESNPELAAARARGIPTLRRGLFLARLAQAYETVVAVAGSHGKTTVTAMLAHIAREQHAGVGYVVGGDVPSLGRSAQAGDGTLLITEVDESDGTQAEIRSSFGVVTNMDDDHCWSVGGEEALVTCFRSFAARAKQIVAGDSLATRQLLASHPEVEFVAEDGDAPRLQVAGTHNRWNARMAARLGEKLGISKAAIATALERFSGVDRRLSVRFDGAVTVVEDYAHHPIEVAASIQAVRELYGGRFVRVLFQPHRHERVARYAQAFAEELSAADDVWVLPPFGAWLDDDDTGDPMNVVRQLRVPSRYCPVLSDAVVGDLMAEVKDGDVVVVMGAGDVTELVNPLVGALVKAGQPA